ncbi:NifX-associated nitrogen fixation protein [Mesorhizobium carmichaelinearum]|uniref:NifX-associated nitrogen fixation protein n=1 Tax=Mesorhizobium carmichaelinearum TaxID=1208188 RepID=UPI000BA2F619|nr:NifX-associated nitrogen fixation protein [Mesorhizobium carmichaelinearum]
MSDVAISAAVAQDEAALATPFVKCLVRLIRAQDSYGSWEGKPDAELLADFILTKDQRRAIPIIGNPDPDVLWRLDKFYAAVGLAIEERCGLMASPMMEVGHEGFGRVLFTAGRLVLLSKTLRDVHRFGFETFWKLAATGTKLAGDAITAIESYPDVARA